MVYLKPHEWPVLSSDSRVAQIVLSSAARSFFLASFCSFHGGSRPTVQSEGAYGVDMLHVNESHLIAPGW